MSERDVTHQLSRDKAWWIWTGPVYVDISGAAVTVLIHSFCY
jgi:hypothetical protein